MLSTTKTLENSERPLSQSTASHTPEQLATERLVGIDVLRGLAVLMVVTNHVPHYAHGGFRQNPWFFPALMMDLGYLGVALFVLISGFCIHRRAAIGKATVGDPTLNWVQFWKKRFWRLYPPYLAAIAFSLACAVLLGQRRLEIFRSIVPDLLTHLFLIHNLTASYSNGLGNGAFWSLGMEEQLYLLYIPLLVLIRRRSTVFAIGIAASTTILWRILITSPMMSSHDSVYGFGMWIMWPFHYWLHWALGALAVDAYFGNYRMPAWCSSLTVGLATGFVGLLSNRLTFDFVCKTKMQSTFGLQAWSEYVPRVSNVGELAFAVAFFCLLNWCVQVDKHHFLLRNRLSFLIAGIGQISYSVYLIHLPVIYVLERYLPFSHSVTDWILRMLIYVGTALVAGAIFYGLVERWFLAGRCPRFWQTQRATLVAEKAVTHDS
jgi:peptidoglycan/LPS O-acetylase OafA/YrhL